jgi:hypothetical protein
MRGPLPIVRASSKGMSSNSMGGDGWAMRGPLCFSKETGQKKAPGATAQGTSELDSLI